MTTTTMLTRRYLLIPRPLWTWKLRTRAKVVRRTKVSLCKSLLRHITNSPKRKNVEKTKKYPRVVLERIGRPVRPNARFKYVTGAIEGPPGETPFITDEDKRADRGSRDKTRLLPNLLLTYSFTDRHVVRMKNEADHALVISGGTVIVTSKLATSKGGAAHGRVVYGS